MPLSQMTITGSYDHTLVALSILLSILASYAALDLAGRVTSAHGGIRALWLGGGAISMGLGIWSMHYVGMLALRLSVPVEYDWPTVGVSLLAAILASAFALFVVSREQLGLARAVAGSVMMGGGIASMHYIGMEAMRLPAMCVYSWPLVELSIAVAVAISMVAIWLTFSMRAVTTGGGWKKAASALLMGAAIPTLHYTGMAAVKFTPLYLPPASLAHAVSISSLGTVGIISVTMMVLGLTMVTSQVDRQFSLQASELSFNERRYHRIVETSFDAFVGMDPTGRITDWNSQAESMFGWALSQASGKHFSEMMVLDKDLGGKEVELKLLLSSAQSDMPRKRLELMALRRDGSKFPVELMISTISLGDTFMFAAFVHDATTRKRALQDRENAKNQAEAANRAKSEFLANMSHEIRTPMNGILGMTDLALDTELTSEQREYLETVKLSADSLLTIINDILDFSKIEAGKVDLEAIDFDLRECLESILKTHAVRADEKGLELLCEFAPDVPEIVKGDGNRLRQIIVNLLGNAIKFTAQGEVALKVSVDSADPAFLLAHFIVSDTGVGIAPEKRSLIFQPFAQADSSTTRKYGGTGLGLTISMRLVELMGGKLWVTSELGRGTQFHFTARFGVSETKKIDAAASAPPEILRGTRVLIVDDNRTNQRILEGLLRRWEMRSSTAESGEEAIEQLSRGEHSGDPYKLILTDMVMPEMDGFTLVERIRQRKGTAAATIMMLTSAGRRGDAVRCQDLGVAAYLLKPVRKSELRNAIAQALGAREQGTPLQLITRYSLRDANESTIVLRILLAEDNAVNQLLASRLLEKRGHRVTIVANGREAVLAAEKQAFDLILMDMQMPEMDGFEATEAIRKKEQSGSERVPIIALTAHAMKGDRERCLSHGMDGYLTKPIRPQELDAMLEPYAGRRTPVLPAEETAEQSK
jgi:two-component system, sensor histidine kinase and response regulator